ncbi:MAG: type II secretion system protein [Candidatus Giovannonibacteria bacterium]|nr:MAG: type II secretion system protein [Candidatus Giovannonibacteria bacterium]
MPRGYTILETVVYIGILAVIAVLALGAILSVYQSFAKTQIERKLALSGDVALETMVKELRAATTTSPAGVFGASPGALQLGPKRFFISGSTLQVKDGAGSLENLTASDVTVSALIFYKTASTNSEIVKIEMALQAGSGIFSKTKNFYGSAVLRGNYK